MRTGLRAQDIPIRMSEPPIIPIYAYDPVTTLTVAKELYNSGVYVNPVLPPAAVPNECLLRTSYMATHTEPVLGEAMDIIQSVLQNDPVQTGK